MSGEKGKRPTDLSNFIDQHLQEIRWASYGLGAFSVLVLLGKLKAWASYGLGAFSVLVLLGKLKAAKKFTAINQIPSRYITDNYTLQGQVKHITNKGVLLIDHTPIIELKWIPGVFSVFRRKDESGQYLHVLPAGLELNPDAVSWLKSHVSRQHVWFQMFDKSQDALFCDIRVKKSYFGRTSVSGALVTQGLCRVKDFKTPPDGEYFHKYLRQMIALEYGAARKEKGMWKEEDSWLKRRSSYLYARGKEKLKRLFKRDKD